MLFPQPFGCVFLHSSTPLPGFAWFWLLPGFAGVVRRVTNYAGCKLKNDVEACGRTGKAHTWLHMLLVPGVPRDAQTLVYRPHTSVQTLRCVLNRMHQTVRGGARE